jgi:hypothetical protein
MPYRPGSTRRRRSRQRENGTRNACRLRTAARVEWRGWKGRCLGGGWAVRPPAPTHGPMARVEGAVPGRWLGGPAACADPCGRWPAEWRGWKGRCLGGGWAVRPAAPTHGANGGRKGRWLGGPAGCADSWANGGRKGPGEGAVAGRSGRLRRSMRPMAGGKGRDRQHRPISVDQRPSTSSRRPLTLGVAAYWPITGRLRRLPVLAASSRPM